MSAISQIIRMHVSKPDDLMRYRPDGTLEKADVSVVEVECLIESLENAISLYLETEEALRASGKYRGNR